MQLCTLADLPALPEFHLVLEAEPEANSVQPLTGIEQSHIEGLLARYHEEEHTVEVSALCACQTLQSDHLLLFRAWQVHLSEDYQVHCQILF